MKGAALIRETATKTQMKPDGGGSGKPAGGGGAEGAKATGMGVVNQPQKPSESEALSGEARRALPGEGVLNPINCS